MHDPSHVAHIAGQILAGHHDAEPHHIRAAVAAAKAILDEANKPEPVGPVEGAVEVQAAAETAQAA